MTRHMKIIWNLPITDLLDRACPFVYMLSTWLWQCAKLITDHSCIGHEHGHHSHMQQIPGTAPVKPLEDYLHWHAKTFFFIASACALCQNKRRRLERTSNAAILRQGRWIILRPGCTVRHLWTLCNNVRDALKTHTAHQIHYMGTLSCRTAMLRRIRKIATGHISTAEFLPETRRWKQGSQHTW